METSGAKKESGEIKKPFISDPWQLMEEYYESDRYKKAFEEFYENKNIDPSVSQKEKERVFLDSNQAKVALVDFASRDVVFKYEPGKFSSRSQDYMRNYAGHIKDINKMLEGRMNDDTVLALDELRFKYHNEIAQSLVDDGVAPSGKIGRAIARLVLIDKGLDTLENARLPDFIPSKRT